MYCPYCGKENENTVKFCVSCGKSLVDAGTGGRAERSDGENGSFMPESARSVHNHRTNGSFTKHDKEAVRPSGMSGMGGAASASMKKKRSKKVFVIVALLLIVLLALGAFFGKGVWKSHQWKEYYDLGSQYLTENNYEEAVVAFTNAIEVDEKKPEAYVGRGDAYVGCAEVAEKSEKFEEAAAMYEKAVEDYETAVQLGEDDAENKQQYAETQIEAVEMKNEETEALAYFEEHREEANVFIRDLLNCLGDDFDTDTADSDAILYQYATGPFNIGYTHEWMNESSLYPSVTLEAGEIGDPRNIFQSGVMVCDSDNADWILRNIFNMEPKHSSEVYCRYEGMEEYDGLYYQDGKYYVGYEGIGGDVICDNINITDITFIGDDTFQIKYSYAYDAMYGAEQEEGKAEIKGKTIDNKFYWSVLSFSSGL